MATHDEVGRIINSLTSDEDMRQELWLHYISGNTVESLPLHVELLKFELSEELKLKRAVERLLRKPPSVPFKEILDKFTDFEKGILCLLLLDFTMEDIASYKGLNKIRLRHTIMAIRDSSYWAAYHSAIKEDTDY